MRSHVLRASAAARRKDPYFASVRLLLHGEGANDSTLFVDRSSYARSIAVFGDARIRTNVYKFGNSSIFFDGTGDYLTTPGGTEFPFSFSNDFTIEAWIYPTSFSGDPNIFSQRNPDNGMIFRVSANGKLTFFRGEGVDIFQGSTSIFLNTWNHVALCRQANTITLWLNGIQDGSKSVIADLSSITAVNIGRDPRYVTEYFTGYMDELRVTIGVARYAGSFTPPTDRFPDQ